ncbi:hypothetical protein WS95_29075 [Burkholderia sp. MSMB1826]|nr:hypothetical protein WS95_29075 [Burkholderia sp. MSMB1826]KWE49810.1 hypothetical protein WT53_30545 [Burkholderia sp. MSMB2157WGS]
MLDDTTIDLKALANPVDEWSVEQALSFVANLGLIDTEGYGLTHEFQQRNHSRGAMCQQHLQACDAANVRAPLSILGWAAGA